jgi:RNA polymerase sigma-70 factor, ECF subfamily
MAKDVSGGGPRLERSDQLELFDTLYEANAAAVHDYLLGRTGDTEVARDLLQEACIRLWRAVAELRDLTRERQRAWLFTVARNLVVDFYRSRASAAAARDALGQQAFRVQDATAPAAETDVISRNELELVDAAIARLPESLRTVLVLQVLGDRTSAEIGELLGRPPGTVRYQLAQARRRLAAELELMREQEQEVSS